MQYESDPLVQTWTSTIETTRAIQQRLLQMMLKAKTVKEVRELSDAYATASDGIRTAQEAIRQAKRQD